MMSFYERSERWFRDSLGASEANLDDSSNSALLKESVLGLAPGLLLGEVELGQGAL